MSLPQTRNYHSIYQEPVEYSVDWSITIHSYLLMLSTTDITTAGRVVSAATWQTEGFGFDSIHGRNFFRSFLTELNFFILNYFINGVRPPYLFFPFPFQQVLKCHQHHANDDGD